MRVNHTVTPHHRLDCMIIMIFHWIDRKDDLSLDTKRNMVKYSLKRKIMMEIHSLNHHYLSNVKDR